MDKIEEEIYKDIKFNNKIIKSLLLLLLLIVVIICAIIYIYMNKLVTPTITEIDLLSVSAEEKEKLKNMNFLELENTPKSINFINLKLESGIRESQFYINFSVDREETIQFAIERNSSEKTMNIIKLFEEDNKYIYEAKTHFTSNSKDYKWDYLYELINKYKK